MGGIFSPRPRFYRTIPERFKFPLGEIDVGEMKGALTLRRPDYFAGEAKLTAGC